MNEKNMRVARGEIIRASMWQQTTTQSKPFQGTLISEQHSLTNPYNSRRKKLRTLMRGVIFIRQAVANGENSRERSLSVMRYSRFFHFPTTSSFYVTFIQALIESVTTTSP